VGKEVQPVLSLTKRYHPITGEPLRREETYWEALPCDALKPYIRCFWGTLRPIPAGTVQPTHEQGLVIPDTCMDIIFDVDYTGNSYAAAFCTLDEHSYRTGSSGAPASTTATFAIRFYAWTACLFADWDFTGKKNAVFDPREMFRRLTAVLEPCLFDTPGLAGKIAIAEQALLGQLEGLRPQPELLNAVHHLLTTDGRARIADLAGYACVSPRKLERLFQYHMGVSPTSFASLVRYQLLWQELAQAPRPAALDLVAKYGYTDQAHLLHDFKRRHLMTPAEALRFAGLRP
jgi:AraC-like DNA-binding protein